MKRVVGQVTDQEIWKETDNKGGEVWPIMYNMGS